MATPKRVRCRGKWYPVRGTMRVGREEYLILNQLRGGVPGRLQAVDPKASPDGEMRCIYLLPKADETLKRLKPLVRLSEDNDHVPTIIKYDRRRDDIVVVCNWIWGTPLQTVLDKIESGKGRRFSSYEATRMFRSFGHGIGHLHNNHCVVHGDIKPDNLILTRQNRLVLIDFGSAWTLERMVDRDPNDGASPPHAAPEVLRGEPPSFASEQFSATVIYYQLLTGQIPYDQVGGMAGAGAGGSHPGLSLEPPSRIAPGRDRTPRRIWKQIDDITHRGLQLDRLKRYPNASEWLDSIDGVWFTMKMENKVTGRNQWLLNLIDGARRLLRRPSSPN